MFCHRKNRKPRFAHPIIFLCVILLVIFSPGLSSACSSNDINPFIQLGKYVVPMQYHDPITFSIHVVFIIIDGITTPLVNHTINYREYQLVKAVELEDFKKVETLLKHGVSPDAEAFALFSNSDNQKPALIIAIEKNNLDIMKLLLENGAKVKRKKANEEPFILEAVRASKDVKIFREMLELLIKHGADINAKWYGGTVLLAAAGIEDKSELIEVMIDNGAAVNYQTPDRRTALENAVRRNNIHNVQILLQKGADINVQGFGGNTALIAAVHSKNIPLIQILLNKGANSNIQDNFGRTALMIAIWQESISIIQTLLDAGADINIQDSMGRTALVFAVSQENANIPIIQTLLKGGAEINIKDRQGKTAMDHAIRRNHQEVIELLNNSSQ